MQTKRVEVVPYDKRWVQSFLEIKAEIKEALGDLALTVEHVGSTSVEGLSAKPVIDIDVVIADETVLDAVISALATIGYEHEGNLGIEGREAFRYTGKDHLQKHHLYVCPKNSPELRRHLAFRDYLRSHPAAAEEYGRIKAEGARQFPNDIDGYVAYKSHWIREVYRSIGVESRLRSAGCSIPLCIQGGCSETDY